MQPVFDIEYVLSADRFNCKVAVRTLYKDMSVGDLLILGDREGNTNNSCIYKISHANAYGHSLDSIGHGLTCLLTLSILGDSCQIETGNCFYLARIS
jgi:hypothetical protein